MLRIRHRAVGLSCEAGVSLTELLWAMATMGMLASLGLVSFLSYAENQDNAASAPLKFSPHSGLQSSLGADFANCSKQLSCSLDN